MDNPVKNLILSVFRCYKKEEPLTPHTLDNINTVERMLKAEEMLFEKYQTEKHNSKMLLDTLKRCEWSARKVRLGNKTIRYCPICRNGDNIGHKQDCALKKALDECN